jgi:flagellar basal body rod protein FlgG
MLGASLRSDAEALRVTGQNVANLQTLGYRRQISVVESAFESLATNSKNLASSVVPPILKSATDWHAGSLQASNNPWHVALEGDGYFVLSTPAGEQVTRRGDFGLDASGKLVSREGFAVLGESGEIVPPSGAPTIDLDGSIRINGQVIDRLRRVAADVGALTPAGDSRYATSSQSALTEGVATTVRQGFVEGSNVAPTDELLRLMETMRHFDTTQHFVRGANDMLNNAISTLGKI